MNTTHSRARRATVLVLTIAILVGTPYVLMSVGDQSRYKVLARHVTDSTLRGGQASSRLEEKLQKNQRFREKYEAARAASAERGFAVADKAPLIVRRTVRIERQRVHQGPLAAILGWFSETAYAQQIDVIEGGWETIYTLLDDGTSSTLEMNVMTEEFSTSLVSTFDLQVSSDTIGEPTFYNTDIYQASVIPRQDLNGRALAMIMSVFSPTVCAQCANVSFLGNSCSVSTPTMHQAIAGSAVQSCGFPCVWGIFSALGAQVGVNLSAWNLAACPVCVGYQVATKMIQYINTCYDPMCGSPGGGDGSCGGGQTICQLYPDACGCNQEY